jgi:hypothetical protein
MPEPFALRREEAAAYVGVSAGHFDKAVDEGAMPEPTDLVGVKVWPRRALERALDPEGQSPVNPWDED